MAGWLEEPVVRGSAEELARAADPSPSDRPPPEVATLTSDTNEFPFGSFRSADLPICQSADLASPDAGDGRPGSPV